jgi:hypothetical protein
MDWRPLMPPQWRALCGWRWGKMTTQTEAGTPLAAPELGAAQAEASGQPSRRKLPIGLLKGLVSGVLLVVLLMRIDARAVGRALADVNWIGVAAALALFIAGIFIRAYRWQILLRGLDVPVPLRTLSALYFVGAFFNTVLPSGFGGDAVKAAELAHTSGQAGAAVGTVVIDRFLGIVVLLAMGAAALLLADDWVNLWLTWIIVGLLAAALAGYWLLRQRRLMRRLSKLAPQRLVRLVERPALALYEGLQGYSRRTLTAALLTSLVFNMTWVGVNVLLGWALGIQATLAQYLVFVPLVSLSLLIPSIGGLGVRELTYVGLFGLVGVPQEQAFALGILVYAITVLTGLIGGVIYLVQGIRQGDSAMPAKQARSEERPEPGA